jgi:hypothetical protein
MFIIACLLGAIAGAIGFIPQLILQRKAIYGSKFMRSNSVAFGLLGVVISMVIYMIFIVIFWSLASELLLFFAISLVVVFLAVAIISALANQKR